MSSPINQVATTRPRSTTPTSRIPTSTPFPPGPRAIPIHAPSERVDSGPNALLTPLTPASSNYMSSTTTPCTLSKPNLSAAPFVPASMMTTPTRSKNVINSPPTVMNVYYPSPEISPSTGVSYTGSTKHSSPYSPVPMRLNVKHSQLSTTCALPSACTSSVTTTTTISSGTVSVADQFASLSLHEDNDERVSIEASPLGSIPTTETTSLEFSTVNTIEEGPVKGEPDACLFVASLNAQKTDDQLTESVTRHFIKWGPLMNVKVMKDWMNRPYAFVQYKLVSDALRALEESHDTVVDGRHVRVEPARVNRTLFLVKIPKTMGEEVLHQYLSKWGKVEDVTMLINQTTGKSKGCAFAKFRYREDAIRAYLHIRQQGRWGIEWASNLEKSKPETDRHSVFVGQLNAAEVTEQALRYRFGQYGMIESIHLIIAESEAFAFIRWEDEESASLAINAENGKEFQGSRMLVQYRETPEHKSPAVRRPLGREPKPLTRPPNTKSASMSSTSVSYSARGHDRNAEYIGDSRSPSPMMTSSRANGGSGSRVSQSYSYGSVPSHHPYGTVPPYGHPYTYPWTGYGYPPPHAHPAYYGPPLHPYGHPHATYYAPAPPPVPGHPHQYGYSSPPPYFSSPGVPVRHAVHQRMSPVEAFSTPNMIMPQEGYVAAGQYTSAIPGSYNAPMLQEQVSKSTGQDAYDTNNVGWNSYNYDQYLAELSELSKGPISTHSEQTGTLGSGSEVTTLNRSRFTSANATNVKDLMGTAATNPSTNSESDSLLECIYSRTFRNTLTGTTNIPETSIDDRSRHASNVIPVTTTGQNYMGCGSLFGYRGSGEVSNRTTSSGSTHNLMGSLHAPVPERAVGGIYNVIEASSVRLGSIRPSPERSSPGANVGKVSREI